MNLTNEEIQIKKIVIDERYSINSSQYEIRLREDGKTITLNLLSHIKVLANLDPIKTVIEYFELFFRELNIVESNINFKMMLGNKKCKEYLNYIKKEINDNIKLISSYHFNIFPIRLSTYKNLADVYIDGTILEKPIYDHTGVTGRTSIKQGFNFLTLKKEKRKDIFINNKNQNLVEVDFKSCEPFFYLLATNNQVEGSDVYSWIKNQYNIKVENRDVLKRGILSMIYGANESTISRIMNISQNKVKQIKEDMGINALKSRLEKEFNKNGFVRNYYGRPITSDNNLVNYWIQSSTVDFCSLSFKSFCDNNKVQPAYFIHDSMTFVCDKNKTSELLRQDQISDPVSKIKIPVEYNILK